MSATRKNRQKRRKRERKVYKGECFNKHHIIPRSRGGRDSDHNLAYVNQIEHDKYHWLFSNKTPYEILEYLIDTFWNGETKWLSTTIKRRLDMLYRPLSEVVKYPDSDFWRMNKREYSTCDIEWTPKGGGWLRGRVCDLYDWCYQACPDSSFAENEGYRMIDRLKKDIEARELDNNKQICSFYQGA